MVAGSQKAAVQLKPNTLLLAGLYIESYLLRRSPRIIGNAVLVFLIGQPRV